MAVDFEFKSKYNVDDLLSIMRILREPGGCPWDMEQTHESIKKNFIEETYEVVEAIDKKDKELLCEELGDVYASVYSAACAAVPSSWSGADCKCMHGSGIDRLCRQSDRSGTDSRTSGTASFFR